MAFIVPIEETHQDQNRYKAALDHLEDIFDVEPNTPKGKEHEFLALLLDHYEAQHYPIGPPDLTEAMKCRIEQSGSPFYQALERYRLLQ